MKSRERFNLKRDWKRLRISFPAFRPHAAKEAQGNDWHMAPVRFPTFRRKCVRIPADYPDHKWSVRNGHDAEKYPRLREIYAYVSTHPDRWRDGGR